MPNCATAAYVPYGSVVFVLGMALGLGAPPAATALLCAGLLIAAQTGWRSLLGDAAGIGGPDPVLI